MKPEPLAIPCTDGPVLSGRLFRPSGQPAGTVVIAPALGVPQGFYAAMATFLARRHFNGITFDYRGCGDSLIGAPPGPDIRLDQWGSLDVDAALRLGSSQPGRSLFLLGHSAGGQLFGLAPASRHLDGLVMVSSLIPWWRSFPWPWNLRVWVLMHGIMPLFSIGRGTFPARRLKISSMDVPSGVTRQWCRWGRRPDYFFDPRWGLDLHRYAEFGFRALICHIDDDHYAPWPAIEALLDKFPRMEKDIWHVDSSRAPDGVVGHVNFFREHMKDVYWGRIADWLDACTAGEAI